MLSTRASYVLWPGPDQFRHQSPVFPKELIEKLYGLRRMAVQRLTAGNVVHVLWILRLKRVRLLSEPEKRGEILRLVSCDSFGIQGCRGWNSLRRNAQREQTTQHAGKHHPHRRHP